MEVDGTGQKGWVENARLIWRLPDAGEKPRAERATPLVSIPALAEASPNVAAPKPPTEPTVRPNVTPQPAESPDDEQPEPSVFDSF